MISRILFFALLLAFVLAKSKSTQITFFAQFQEDQAQDYIELGLSVTSQGKSLVGAMDQASKIADQVKSIATQFCQSHIKNKKQAKSTCKQIVDIGNYQIQPQYQIVKRQSKFMGFEVVHEVTIKVLAVNDISDLADEILKLQSVKIISFEWKPLEQENSQQAAVKQGVQQAEGLCYQIGMHYQRTLNVEQVEVQENDQNAVYKFQIQCGEGRKPKSQKKKNEKQKKDDSKQGKTGQKKEDKKEKTDKKQKQKDEL